MATLALVAVLQADLDALIERLSDDDIAARAEAQAELLRRRPSLEWTRQQRAASRDPEVRGRLHAVVGALRGDPWSLWTEARFDEALAALAEDEGATDPARSRDERIQTLWKPWGLRGAWGCSSDRVYDSEFDAMWSVGTLVSVIDGKDEERAHAILALSEGGATTTVWVTPMLRSSSEGIREAAACILRNIKDERALPELQRAWREEKDQRVKKYVEEALTKITRRSLAEALKK